MDDTKIGIPHTTARVESAERALGLDLGPAGGNREIWRKIVGTELDKEPDGRFSYVLTELAPDEPRLMMALRAMREVMSRFRERDGQWAYAALCRSELDPTRLEKAARKLAPGFKGEFALMTMEELVPRRSWMTDDQWSLAFLRYFQVMTHNDGARPLLNRASFACLFSAIPFRPQEFEMPARCLFPGGLVHAPLMGDLAELLAYAAGLCVGRDLAAARRACDFVALAAKAPPLIVEGPDGPHLIFLCHD